MVDVVVAKLKKVFKEYNSIEGLINLVDMSQNQRWYETLIKIMITKTSTPLYENTFTSMLLVIFFYWIGLILQMCWFVMCSWVFSFLWNELLPKDNKMPSPPMRSTMDKHILGLNKLNVCGILNKFHHHGQWNHPIERGTIGGNTYFVKKYNITTNYNLVSY